MSAKEGDHPPAADQSPQPFNKPAKEAELNGMVIERLREMARLRNLSTIGDKGTVIECILNDMIGVRTDPYCLLEEAIMSWKMKEQQDYLKKMNEAIYGTKPELTARIMAKVPIADAVAITKDYRTKMNAGKKTKAKEIREKF